jgi:hypothetical protein
LTVHSRLCHWMIGTQYSMERIMSSRFQRSRRCKGQTPAVESLESRAYFSSGTPELVVSVPGPIPTTAISGEKFVDHIAVSIANDGTGTTSGPYSVTLFASTTTALTVNSSQIFQKPESPHISTQRNKSYTFHVPTLPVNLDGTYYIIAEVSGGQGTAVGASKTTIAITPAHIDLSNVVTKVPTTGRLGQKISVVLTVSNLGNEEAKGKLAVAFSDSIFQSGASAVALGTVSTTIAIKPGFSKPLHLRVPVPLGTLSGNQYIVADIDPLDVFHDTNLANNTAFSGSPVSLH